jgi:hypothetical protein
MELNQLIKVDNAIVTVGEEIGEYVFCSLFSLHLIGQVLRPKEKLLFQMRLLSLLHISR